MSYNVDERGAFELIISLGVIDYQEKLTNKGRVKEKSGREDTPTLKRHVVLVEDNFLSFSFTVGQIRLNQCSKVLMYLRIGVVKISNDQH